MTLTPRRRCAHSEAGQASAFVICTLATVIACLGLVWDAGGMLIQRGRASSIADEAARAGAQQLDLLALRATGQRRLDPDAAASAAEDYLAQAGAQGSTDVQGTTITVTARLPYTSQILPLTTRTAEARATAAARTPT